MRLPGWLLAVALLCPATVFGADVVMQPAEFAIPGEASCLDARCHTEQATKKYIHPPAATAQTCHLCHIQAEAQVHRFSLMDSGKGLCRTCHEQAEKGRVRHPPAAQGMCTACHDPHQSDYKAHLKKKPGAELCLTCHAREGGGDTGSVHPPYAAGMCLTCHDPHESDTVNLLKGVYPTEMYAPYARDAYFCLGCHGTDAFAEPRTLNATRFRNGNLNLHFRHVNREKGRSCRACHHHHASSRTALIRKQMPFGDTTLMIRDFQQTETGGSCAPPCHQVAVYDRLVPAPVTMKVTPRPGKDATPEALQQAESGSDDDDW